MLFTHPHPRKARTLTLAISMKFFLCYRSGMSAEHADVTLLLSSAAQGDQEAASRLIEAVYAQLRALAGSYAGGRQANHTLQPTALVHEAFVRLVQAPNASYNDRGHFFAVAATAMRQILTDHARRKKALKRGGEQGSQHPTDWDRISVQSDGQSSERDIDAIALDEALTELQSLDERRYRVVEMRFFGAMEVDDVARILDVSRSTVEADWRAARAWLATKLGP